MGVDTITFWNLSVLHLILWLNGIMLIGIPVAFAVVLTPPVFLLNRFILKKKFAEREMWANGPPENPIAKLAYYFLLSLAYVYAAGVVLVIFGGFITLVVMASIDSSGEGDRYMQECQPRKEVC